MCAAGCRLGFVFALSLTLGVAGLLPAAAAPPAQAPTCIVQGDKVASPARIRLGETVQIRLTISSQCPPASYRSADIMLAIDDSFSMASDGKLDAAKRAANTFVDNTDLSIHRLGLVTFHGTAVVAIGLSQDAKAIKDEVNAIGRQSGTNIAAAIDESLEVLTTQGRPGVLPVIILLTDGTPNLPQNEPELAALRSANAAKLAGVELYAVGLGRDVSESLLKQIASTPAHYYFSPDIADLDQIYQSIALVVGDYSVRDLVLQDDLAANITLEQGTANPTATVTGRRLEWVAGLVPASGLTWVYTVTPRIIGTYPTNDQAIATYKDTEGTSHRFVFPKPVVTVLDPNEGALCNGTDRWTIMIHSFPDSVGQPGGQGCNNIFDSGDWAEGAGYPLPMLEYQVTDESGSRELYKGRGIPGPGRVDQRLYLRVCQPPPYRLRLVTEDLNGYSLCSNSPSQQMITRRDFRPEAFRRSEVRFGFVR
jgi:Mg-chelatase subunit ChlD